MEKKNGHFNWISLSEQKWVNLSERYSEQQVNEQLEQLSQRHDASIGLINALGSSVDEKLEQLSDRHAAVVRKINGIEKQ